MQESFSKCNVEWMVDDFYQHYSINIQYRLCARSLDRKYKPPRHIRTSHAEHDKYDEQAHKHEDKTKIDKKAYYLYVSPSEGTGTD